MPAMGADERLEMLRRVYTDTRLPDKPRNALGIARELPAAEMEKMLREATPVSTDTSRELALRRGLSVRDDLIVKGLGSDRLFLAAPKLRGSAEADAQWTPRVQMALSTQ
jgi:hypothetical protein